MLEFIGGAITGHHEDTRSDGKINRLIGKRSAKVGQPSTLRMVIWPEASNAQKSMAAVSAEGSTVGDKLHEAYR